MWEFPNSDPTGDGVSGGNNVGYSYGKPLLVKTKATGWVAMITSGLNNGADDANGAGSFGSGTGPGGDGKGHLWVINPANGKVIKDLPTSVGSSASPSNLLYVTAFARNATIDQTIDFVFGGDMQGNLWVWDFTGATLSDWTVTKLATVQDPSGNAQPITVAPEVSLVNGKPIVYFGTGQYFGESDVRDFSGASDTVPQNDASKQIHSVYGIWVDWTIDPLTGKRSFVSISGNPRTSSLVARTVTRDCTKGTSQVGADPSSTIPINFGSGVGQQRGWYFDLPAASCNALETPTVGERIVVRPNLTGGVLQVVGNIPNSTDPCSPGGSSWLYSVNYLTGGGVTDSDAEGLFLGSALASRAVMITLPSGKVVSYVRMNASNVADSTTVGGLRDADTYTKGRPVQALDPKLLKLQTKGKRFTWREMFQ
jgi:type IV pilus assembly protein PilY1